MTIGKCIDFVPENPIEKVMDLIIVPCNMPSPVTHQIHTQKCFVIRINSTMAQWHCVYCISNMVNLWYNSKHIHDDFCVFTQTPQKSNDCTSKLYYFCLYVYRIPYNTQWVTRLYVSCVGMNEWNECFSLTYFHKMVKSIFWNFNFMKILTFKLYTHSPEQRDFRIIHKIDDEYGDLFHSKNIYFCFGIHKRFGSFKRNKKKI